jgi:hypothetical protein
MNRILGPVSEKPKSGRWHLCGRLLPEGEALVDLWVAEGRISRTSLADCEPLEGDWNCPGLLDGHAHVSWTEETLSLDGIQVPPDPPPLPKPPPE